MPELAHIAHYLEALRGRILGRRLERGVRRSPFLRRTADRASSRLLHEDWLESLDEWEQQ